MYLKLHDHGIDPSGPGQYRYGECSENRNETLDDSVQLLFYYPVFSVVPAGLTTAELNLSDLLLSS
jgi:hypothetical protein